MASPIGYLLDTNILLYLLRENDVGKKIDQQFALRASLTRCIISVVTVGEMFSLARKFKWGKPKCDSLEALLEELTWIDINVQQVLHAYGQIDHHSNEVGRPMGKNDVWIAATAHVTGMTLMTSDKDFEHLDGKFINRIWVDPDSKVTS